MTTQQNIPQAQNFAAKMSLSKISSPNRFSSCLKNVAVLDKSFRQSKKISNPQTVRVLVTCRSSNVRNISYALKTPEKKRRSLDGSLNHIQAKSLPKRHQSIALNGLSDNAETKNMFPNFSVSVEILKKKISSFLFSSIQKTQNDAQASSKPFSCIPGAKGLPVFGSALDYTVIGKFSPQHFHVALRSRHEK